MTCQPSRLKFNVKVLLQIANSCLVKRHHWNHKLKIIEILDIKISNYSQENQRAIIVCSFTRLYTYRHIQQPKFRLLDRPRLAAAACKLSVSQSHGMAAALLLLSAGRRKVSDVSYRVGARHWLLLLLQLWLRDVRERERTSRVSVCVRCAKRKRRKRRKVSWGRERAWNACDTGNGTCASQRKRTFYVVAGYFGPALLMLLYSFGWDFYLFYFPFIFFSFRSGVWIEKAWFFFFEWDMLLFCESER